MTSPSKNLIDCAKLHPALLRLITEIGGPLSEVQKKYYANEKAWIEERKMDKAEREELWNLVQELKGKRAELKKPLKRILLQPYLEELHVREEYDDQLQMWQEVGIVREQDGVLGIDSWDGKTFYPFPTYDQVIKRFEQMDVHLLRYKMDQEFTQLCIVPFGASWVRLVKDLTERYKVAAKAGKLKRTDDTETPITEIHVTSFYFGEDEEELLYRIQNNTKEGALKSKADVVGDGFRIILLPKDPRIPRKDKGKAPGGRRDLEASQEGVVYRDLIYGADAQSPYRGEQGLTLESWISWAHLILRKAGQVLHDLYHHKDSGCWLTGNERPYGDLPVASFNQDRECVDLRNYFPEFDFRDRGEAGLVEIG